MKYIKPYNEGVLRKVKNLVGRKPKITQNIVDSIIVSLHEDGWPATAVSQSPERVVIKVRTDSKSSRNDWKEAGDIFISVDATKSYIVNFYSEKDGKKIRWIANDTIDDWEEIDDTSFPSNIHYIVNRIKAKEEGERKEREFYSQLPEDVVKDLLSDLSDITGKYVLGKNVNNNKIGFCWEAQFLLEDYKILNIDARSGISLPVGFNGQRFHTESTTKDCIIPNDFYLDVAKELNSLRKRLMEGFGFDCGFSINDKHLNIWIFKPKES